MSQRKLQPAESAESVLKFLLGVLKKRSEHFYESDAKQAISELFGRKCYGIEGKRFVEAWAEATEIENRVNFSALLMTLEDIFPYLTWKERGDCLFFVKDELKTVARELRPLASEIHDCLRTLVKLNADIGKSGDELCRITGVFARGEFEAKFPKIAAARNLSASDKLRVALGLYPRNRRPGALPNNKYAVGNRSRHKTGSEAKKSAEVAAANDSKIQTPESTAISAANTTSK